MTDNSGQVAEHAGLVDHNAAGKAGAAGGVLQVSELLRAGGSQLQLGLRLYLSPFPRNPLFPDPGSVSKAISELSRRKQIPWRSHGGQNRFDFDSEWS